MTAEEVIIESLEVRIIGQRIYFQVMLPKDTKRIIGFEYGVMEKSGYAISTPSPPGDTIPGPIPEDDILEPFLNIVSNKVIGSLTLKIAGEENLFFQGDLVENRNYFFGEMNTLKPSVWVCGVKRHETDLSVGNNTPLVEGFFHDSYGVNEYTALTYKLGLYLWIEKK